MAEIVTGTVTGQVDMASVLKAEADIRRETAIGVGSVSAKVAETGWQVENRVSRGVDRVTDQDTAYFIASQQINFQNATALAALTAKSDFQNAQVLAAIQLAQAQNAAATALASAALGEKVTSDGNMTRALINTNTVDELRFKLARAQDKNDDHEHRGRKCCDKEKELKLNFGPPLSAQVDS